MRTHPVNIARVPGLTPALAAKADLVGGKVARAQLPRLDSHDPRDYGTVTIGTFGTIPSGTVHDDNATAIAAAIAGAQSEGGELFLPGLLWASTDAIDGNNLPVSIRGTGRMSGIATADTSGTLVDLVGSEGVRFQNVRLFGPCDAQPGTTPSTFTTKMLRVGRTDATMFDPQIIGVEILGGDIGLECVNVAWLRFVHSIIQHFRTAGLKLTQPLNTDIGDAFIGGAVIHGPNSTSAAYQATASGIWITANSGTRIHDAKVYCRTNQAVLIDITEGATDATYPQIDFVVDSCHFDSGQLVAGSAAVRAQSIFDGATHNETGSKLIGLTVTNSDIFACEYGLDVDSDGGAFSGVNYTNNRSRGGAAVRITGSGTVEGLTVDGNDIDRVRGGVGESAVTKFLTISGPTVSESYIDTRGVRGYTVANDAADTYPAFDVTEAQTLLAPASGVVAAPLNTGAFGNFYAIADADLDTVTWDVAGADAIVDGAHGVISLHYSTADFAGAIGAPSGFTIHVAKKEDGTTDKALPTAADNLHVDIPYRVKGTRIFYDIVNHGAITDLTSEGGGGGGFTMPTLSTLTTLFLIDPSVGVYDATSGGSDITGSDGSSIGRIEDVISSQVFSQATGGARPTIQTNELNGCNVIRLDGGDSLIGALAATQARPYTMIAVAKTTDTDTTVAQRPVLDIGNKAIVRQRGPSDFVTTTQFRWTFADEATGQTSESDRTVGSWHYIVCEVTSNGGGESTIRVDGTQVAQNWVGANGLASADAIGIGAKSDGSNGFIGDIALVILLAGVDATDRAAIESEIATYFGL